jgi:alpha-tubulin suppressor-like RCC1 family protein
MPITPSSKDYTISNSGTAPINWAVTSNQTWIDISPASGTLNPGDSVVVTVAFNEEADALPGAEEPYVAILTFSNGTNGCGSTTLEVILTIPFVPPEEGFDLFGFGYNGSFVLGLGDEDMRVSPTQVNDEGWVALGGAYYCSIGIQADGTMWSWGYGGAGGLGHGDLLDKEVPTQIGTDTDWDKLSVNGSDHCLAIKTDGTLWSWGLNSAGELGRNLPTYEDIGDPYYPDVEQVGSDLWTMVAAGNNHSLAIRDDGTLWSCGWDNDGQLGLGGGLPNDEQRVFAQIGSDTWIYVSGGDYYSMGIKSDGTLWSWGDFGGYFDSVVPVQVETDSDWVKISCGASGFAIGLKSDGTLWAIGSNNSGKLGVGDTTTRTVFTQIGTDTDWIDISCGGEHSLARKSDNSVWSWGDNNSWGGQLGLGDTTDRWVPTKIETLADCEFLFAGWTSSLVLATNLVFMPLAWGADSLGELGFPGDTTDKLVPTESPSCPVPKQFAAGEFFTIVRAEDGTLWSTGLNSQGSLGVGDFVDRDVFTQIGTDNDWAQVSCCANGLHAGAIKNDGTLWMWGENTFGQCGLGDNVDKNAPVQVGTDTDWERIFVGADHTLAIKGGGFLFVWGRGANGRLGLGGTSNFNTPQLLGIESAWRELAGGDNHSLAVKADGTLWAWGRNDTGQLGNGTLTQELSPIQIGSDTNWSKVICLDGGSLGIKTNGQLWGWGDNSEGQLGLGGVDTLVIDPLQVGTDTDWIRGSGGERHSLMIKSNGTLWSTGSNFFGQLGHGGTDPTNVFTQVGSEVTWLQVAAGESCSLGIHAEPVV